MTVRARKIVTEERLLSPKKGGLDQIQHTAPLRVVGIKLCVEKCKYSHSILID